MHASPTSRFLLSAALAFASLLPRSSNATDMRIQASACFVSTQGNIADVVYQDVGIVNKDTTHAATLTCAVPDRSDFLPKNMGTINVDGHAGRADFVVSAFAGTVYQGTNTGGRVSQSQSSTAVQDYQFGFGGTQHGGFFVASDGSDFKYISISLPTPLGSGLSSVRGLFFSS